MTARDVDDSAAVWLRTHDLPGLAVVDATRDAVWWTCNRHAYLASRAQVTTAAQALAYISDGVRRHEGESLRWLDRAVPDRLNHHVPCGGMSLGIREVRVLWAAITTAEEAE